MNNPTAQNNPTSVGRLVENVRTNNALRIQCYHKHAPEATCRLEKVQVREESAWTQKQAADGWIGIQHRPPCEQNIGFVENVMEERSIHVAASTDLNEIKS